PIGAQFFDGAAKFALNPACCGAGLTTNFHQGPRFSGSLDDRQGAAESTFQIVVLAPQPIRRCAFSPDIHRIVAVYSVATELCEASRRAGLQTAHFLCRRFGKRRSLVWFDRCNGFHTSIYSWRTGLAGTCAPASPRHWRQ